MSGQATDELDDSALSNVDGVAASVRGDTRGGAADSAIRLDAR